MKKMTLSDHHPAQNRMMLRLQCKLREFPEKARLTSPPPESSPPLAARPPRPFRPEVRYFDVELVVPPEQLMGHQGPLFPFVSQRQQETDQARASWAGRGRGKRGEGRREGGPSRKCPILHGRNISISLCLEQAPRILFQGRPLESVPPVAPQGMCENWSSLQVASFLQLPYDTKTRECACFES